MNSDILGKSPNKNLVSVIIPTFGARGALKKSIDSVLAQTYNNIELIVVDDNPPKSDGRLITEDIMANYSTLSNVKYHKHPKNKNGAAARNTGIRIAGGDYIAFLDDDDIFLSTKIERQMNFLQYHPEFDAVYCKAKNSNHVLNCIPYEGDASLEMLMGKTSMYTPSLLFRRTSLIEINGFDERFKRHQDFELLLRFFARGYKIGCLQECLLELGNNIGENLIHGKKLKELKELFLHQFNPIIDKLDKLNPGTRNKIYAHHYYAVFLDNLKSHSFIQASKIFVKYFLKSPSTFINDLKNTTIAHLNR